MMNWNLYSNGDKFFAIVVSVLIGLFTAATLYPFIYIAAVSFSSGFAAQAGKVVLTPIDATLEAYGYIVSDPQFWVSDGNTFIYTIGGTVMSLLFIVPSAYALSRRQLKGRRFFNLFIAFTMWFNAGLIPFFLNMRDLGLLDSMFGIILGFAINAFNIILLRNFFESIPQSFEEAALIDEANDFQVLWKVFIPLSKPAIATITLFLIVARWNGFFWAMVLLQSESKIPLQVFLRHTISNLSDDDEFAIVQTAAGFSAETVTAAIIVCSIIPVLIVYPFVQKYFEKGISSRGCQRMKPQMGENNMHKLSLAATLLIGSAISTPAFADGHLRIVDEPLELTIQMNHARYPIYEETWPVEQAARELTGINLINDAVGANMRTDENTGRTEALNLMLASGNVPDIVGSSRIRDFVNQYGPEGAFVPFNDLIAEHAPNIAAYDAERPDIEAAVKASDGQMYYIPYLPDGKYGRAYWIRTDWLNALGLDMPETLDEYEAVLRAFKTQDPNGNGIADEVQFFARQWPELIRLVTLWDGRAHGSNTYHDFLVEDGKIGHGYVGEGYRDGIANLARWYEEGRRLANFGVEGQQYEMVDGEPIFTQEFLDAGPVNRSLYQVGAQLQGRGYFHEYNYEIQWSNEFALEGIALYDSGDYLIPDFLGVAFTADEQRVYDRTWSGIRDYMLERQQSWILGNGDVMADWDEYIATLDEMGMQELLVVMQSAYDRQYGVN